MNLHCPQCLFEGANVAGLQRHIGKAHKIIDFESVVPELVDEQQAEPNIEQPLENYPNFSQNDSDPSELSLDDNNYLPFQSKQMLVLAYWNICENVNSSARERQHKIGLLTTAGEPATMSTPKMNQLIQQIPLLHPELDSGSWMATSFGKQSCAPSRHISLQTHNRIWSFWSCWM